MKTLKKHKYKVLFLVLLVALAVGGHFYLKKKKEDALKEKGEQKLPTKTEAIKTNAPAPTTQVKTERMVANSGDEVLVGLPPKGTGGLKENKSATVTNTAR